MCRYCYFSQMLQLEHAASILEAKFLHYQERCRCYHNSWARRHFLSVILAVIALAECGIDYHKKIPPVLAELGIEKMQ